jgi:hypothetical protein
MRGIEGRIIKLETARRRSADEMLLLWRRPTERAADTFEAAGEMFADGDKVLIASWYGDEPPPPPRWHTELGL